MLRRVTCGLIRPGLQLPTRSCSRTNPDYTVQHSPDRQEFTIHLDEGKQAFVRYHQQDANTWDMYTTQVPDEYGGRGVAAKLAQAALGKAQEDGKTVKLSCWYLDGYVQKNPKRFPDLKVE